MFTKTILVSDSIHGNIQVSNLEKEIMSTQAFNRLHNINQNSTVYLTFPSNRTKRFEHSLGSMHLAGEMFFYSLVNANNDIRNDFLQQVVQEINILRQDKQYASFLRMLLGEHEKLFEDCQSIEIIDPLYLLYTPKIINNEHVFYYTLLFQAVRCSALLHDLGHPPFSHITEAALKELLNLINEISEHERTDRQKAFLDTINNYLEDEIEEPNIALHEEVGNSIADRLFEAMIRQANDSRYKFFICMVQKFVGFILKEKNEFFKSIHSLISGSVESDRLDYIVRDLNNSGFNHSRIEYDRLIKLMKLIKYKNDFLFCSDIRALSTLEDFFIKRAKLYKYVIYHHRAIKTDNLLKNIVVKLSQDYLNEPDTETQTESQVLPFDISGLWKAVKSVYSNKDYFDALIQWDDAWLLAVLRQQYFDKYSKEEEIIKFQLEEFLSNKKNYFSLIKRFEDFLDIDHATVLNLDVDFDNLLSVLGEKWEKLISPLKEIIKQYNVSSDGFVLASFSKLFEGLGEVKFFENCVKESVYKVAKGKYNVKDVFVVFKKIKTGFEVLPNIRKENDLLSQKELFIMISELRKEQKSFPIFFVYVSGEDNEKENFRKAIGKEIACSLNDWASCIIKKGSEC